MSVPCLQRRRQQSSNHVKELRWQNNADEPDQRVHVARICESRRHNDGQRPRKNHKQRNPDAPDHENKIRDDAEGFPAALIFTAFEILEEDWDKYDR